MTRRPNFTLAAVHAVLLLFYCDSVVLCSICTLREAFSLAALRCY